MAKISYNNQVELRTTGYEVLKEAFGTEGALSFLQMYDEGTGDYTKEKYERPEVTREEIKASIMENRKKTAS
ncbi:MAG: hypothetical protein LIO49_05080 [Ruminococcus sp.]|nr:hypothetical protein [Ruminococcus sp.]